MTQQTYDANDILMGGSGSPAWKFDTPGTTKRATITAPPTARQEKEYDPNNPGGGAPKVFPSGDPIMGVVVEVQTTERDPSRDNDDGVRTFYIEGRRLKDAVRAGVRAAGARGLEVGGQLEVTLTHYDTPNDRRSGCNWTVVYTPAGNAALMGDTPAPAQATPQQVYASGSSFGGGDRGLVAPTAPQPAPAAPATPEMTPEAIAAFQQYMAQQGQAAS